MLEKPIDHLQSVPELPELIRNKKNKPPKMAVVDEDNCTGCSACVTFCPVDCIEPVPEDKYDDVSIPPVQVRWNECIGCQVCAKVCDKLTWNAIRMIPTKVFEERYNITVDKKIFDAGHHHGSTYYEHLGFINSINKAPIDNSR